MLVEPVGDVIYQVMPLPIKKKFEPVHGLWVKNSLSLLKLLCLKSTLIFTQAVSLQAFNEVHEINGLFPICVQLQRTGFFNQMSSCLI